MMFCRLDGLSEDKHRPMGYWDLYFEEKTQRKKDAADTKKGKPPAKVIKFVRHAVDDYGRPQYDQQQDEFRLRKQMMAVNSCKTGKDVVRYAQGKCVCLYDWEIEHSRIAKECTLLGWETDMVASTRNLRFNTLSKAKLFPRKIPGNETLGYSPTSTQKIPIQHFDYSYWTQTHRKEHQTEPIDVKRGELKGPVEFCFKNQKHSAFIFALIAL